MFSSCLINLTCASGLQISVFRNTEAGTRLLGVEVVMSQDNRRGVLLAQFGKQLSQCHFLLWRTSVARFAVCIQPSFIADADAVGIVSYAVGSCRFFRSSFLHGSVATDDIVITYHAPSPLTMPKVDVLGRALLSRTDSRAVDD